MFDLGGQILFRLPAAETQAGGPVPGAHGDHVDPVEADDLCQIPVALVTLEHDHHPNRPVGPAQGFQRIGAKLKADPGAGGGNAPLSQGRELSQLNQPGGLFDGPDIRQGHDPDAPIHQRLNVGSQQLGDPHQGHHPQMLDASGEPDQLGNGLGTVLQIQPDQVVTGLRHQLDVGQRCVPAQDAVEMFMLLQQFAETICNQVTHRYLQFGAKFTQDGTSTASLGPSSGPGTP